MSRSDWLTELAHPEKAETFARHMHFWWLVVSDKSIVRDDLPDGWGLMVATSNGLRTVRKPAARDVVPMPHSMTGALMRAIATTETRYATQGDAIVAAS